jgi:hypothetical protein
MTRHIRPALGEPLAAEWVLLTKRGGFDPGQLEAESETANAGK